MLRTASLCCVLLLTLGEFSAEAQSTITGSIGFGAIGVTLTGGTNLETATSCSLSTPYIATESGAYLGVPLSTSVSYSGFQFNPAVSSVNPLWSFTAGGLAYSFEATSVSASYNSALQEWNIGGAGTAAITGYLPTPGDWNVNLSQSGASVVFDSSAGAVAVPEPNSAILLVSGGSIGLAGIVRKTRLRFDGWPAARRQKWTLASFFLSGCLFRNVWRSQTDHSNH